MDVLWCFLSKNHKPYTKNRYSFSVSGFQIFSAEEIEALRYAGQVLHECIDYVGKLVVPGITTRELDRAAEAFIRKHEGAEPAFMGYHGYPATLCTSVNEECVHGIPGDRVLKEGDIIAVDCGVKYKGLNTDACKSFPVGNISPEAHRLFDVTIAALDAGVAAVRKGARVGDISAAVQKTVEGAGFSVVSALTGHGLGKTLHQFPDVPNVGEAGTGPVLPLHTLIAIEPITCTGKDGIVDGKDLWTIKTRDGSLSAHFEHTVLVTEEGCEVIA
ncbi:type I methionyl aminopeptidase [Candidatus Peregrinibacteria bacterium]|nr:type I methionyl aminopeptidase [Candidatus Peregrinibacteria bacterium]